MIEEWVSTSFLPTLPEKMGVFIQKKRRRVDMGWNSLLKNIR